MAHLSNINVRHRLTQVVVLVIVIVSVMLFSTLAKAQTKGRHDKGKYRIAVHKNSDRTCYILHKKRTSMPKHPLLVSSRRSKNNNYKPLAETDEPARLVSSN